MVANMSATESRMEREDMGLVARIERKVEMVEAAGVEPASEKTVNRELSCFFRSHLSRSECLQRTKTHSPPA